MTTTITKEQLSGSTNGRPVKVVATGTPGTTIHTATSTAGELDEVWLWAGNTGASTATLTIELGGSTSPDDLVKVSIGGGSGLVLVVPGIPLNGGVAVKAFASTANVVNIVGFANNIAVT